MLKKLYHEVKVRKIRKWIVIHLTTTLTVAGAVNLFGNRYNFPPQLFDSIVIIALCGLPVTFVLAWFHNKEGKQKFRVGELIFYNIMGLITLSLLSYNFFASSEGAIVTVERSIAVLPFQNFSDSKEDEYFSDGVTEDILTQLSKIGDLKVISRTSVMKYKKSTKTIREIAKELGVETILEGSVRRVGNRIRIVGQLIDAVSDQHLWAETYDRELKDIFQIQSEVAQKIASSLKVRLTENEKGRIEKKSTENIDAYTYYLKGREYYYSYNEEANKNAISFFRKALEFDPNYALAYAGLGDAYAQLSGMFGLGEEWLDSSKLASEKAISLDPDLAEPYKSLGVMYFYSGKLHQSLEVYLKAVQINPNYAAAVANVGSIHWMLGSYDEAKPYLEKSIKLEPTRTLSYRLLGLVYQGVGKYKEAEEYILKAIHLQPNQTFAVAELTKLYIIQKQFDKAKTFLDKLYKEKPDNRHVLSSLGDVYLFSGDYKTAKNYYLKAIEVTSGKVGPFIELAFIYWKGNNKKESSIIFSENLEENISYIESGLEEFNAPYDVARIYSVQGKTDLALKYLSLAIKNGWRLYTLTEFDPLFENLRSNNKFIELMDKLKEDVKEMASEI